MTVWLASIDQLPPHAYEVLGLVVEQEMVGLNVARDWLARIADLLGGRTRAYDQPLRESLLACLNRLAARVQAADGHALIGVRIAMTPVPFKRMTLFQVCVYGTAIRFLPSAEPAGCPADPSASTR
jgi:uncharacterized protein YbjQ (UPF0145 family)